MSYQAMLFNVQVWFLKKILISFAKCFGGDGRVLFQVKPVETNKTECTKFLAFRIAIGLASVF